MIAPGPQLVFASGLSRPGNARPWILAGAPIGVVAGELSGRMRREVTTYARRGGRVFVDSGAFTAASKGRELSFDEVLDTYDELAELAASDGRENLWLVAPDVVGDQPATLALLARYRDRLRALADAGVNLLVPFQKGELDGLELLNATKRALTGDAPFGPAFTPALAYNLHAWSEAEAVAFIRDAAVDEVHLLGGGRAKVEAVQRHFDPYVIGIQGDSCRIAALTPRGRVVDRIARETLDEVPVDVALQLWNDEREDGWTDDREDWKELVRDEVERALFEVALEENGGPNALTVEPYREWARSTGRYQPEPAVELCDYCGEPWECEVAEVYADERTFTLSACCEGAWEEQSRELELIGESRDNETRRAFAEWWRLGNAGLTIDRGLEPPGLRLDRRGDDEGRVVEPAQPAARGHRADDPEDPLGEEGRPMRLISFSMTKDRFLDGTKTVTRRLGWRNLRRGDQLMAVEKAMGLRKGETVQRLGPIEVLDVRRERLDAIDDDDVEREGFPARSAAYFVRRFCAAMGCSPDAQVTRIEFRRVPMRRARRLFPDDPNETT